MLKDKLCWHSSFAQSARGRTREMLKDKLCWHSSFAQSARGRTREMLKDELRWHSSFAQSARGWTRERLQGKLMLPSCPSARGWTRERLKGKLMLPERSRMDTREVPGQTHAGLPARALADGHARGSRANSCWPSCPSARGWRRERLQGKLMLAFLPERSQMDTREAPGQTHAGLPARALAGGHARGSRANSCWPSCPSARGWTRERLQGKLMLAFLPERSRMDTPEAPGQTHAGLPARALADGHARGSRANSCWPSCPSARGRTREKLRDEICWHSSSARALADEHARGSRTNFAGRVSLLRALAGQPASPALFLSASYHVLDNRRDHRDDQANSQSPN